MQSNPAESGFRSLAILASLASLLLATGVEASPVYGTSALGELIGSRSVGGGGLIGHNEWANDFTVDWQITQAGSGWHYEYTFTGLDGSGQEKAIGHTVIDISDDCEGADCVFNVSPSGSVDSGDFDGVTGAVKFDFGGGEDLTYSFDSNRSPVYGHLAVKGGGGPDRCDDVNPSSALACSVGISLPSGDPGKMNTLNYVARPNGITLPEPATGFLVAVGLLAALVPTARREGSARL
jgi:hypothetical protein